MPSPLQLPERPNAPPTLVTPECAAPGCRVTGDQFTMVRCRGCGKWFCPVHVDTAAPARLIRLRASLGGIAYYEGLCASCGRDGRAAAH
jgi:hypothetical protein